MKIPPFSLAKQLDELSQELDSAVLRVLKSGQYIGGEEIDRFEKFFAAATGVPFSVGCNSGTDALVLALRALDIGKGDEVITSSFSFFATAEAISAVGAKPVFVDVHPDSYLIDLNLLEKAITPSTRAILPVHLFGFPVDMERLLQVAKKHGLKVIEDCAQAAGSFWKGRSVGSWGDIGCFSFFPTKNLGGAGDGGAVTTKDPHIAQRIRELAVHGMPRRYLHTQLGYNSRLDALQAAVLNVKLPRLKGWVNKRQLIAKRYEEMLKGIPSLSLPSSLDPEDGCHGWNQYVVRIQNISPKEDTQESQANLKKEISDFDSCYLPRDLLKKKLEEDGVNTIIYYPIPIHLQPAYKSLGHEKGKLPVTETLCKEVLSLPVFPELTIEEQEKVVHSVKKLLPECF